MKEIGSYRNWITGNLLLMLLLFSANTFANKPVTAWTYYNFPPYITGDGKGLAHEFIKLLNDHAQGKYIFQLKVYPRKRLNSLLSFGKQGLVLFVHWSFMQEKDQSKYLWGPILMHDRNEIVSLSSRRISYDGTAQSLSGLRFGGVLGRNYDAFLEKAMAQGEIHRSDTNTEKQNIQKLLRERIDVTTMPQVVLQHLIKNMNIAGKLYVSPQPRNIFTRHILATKQLKQEHEFLSKFVQGLSSNAQWQEFLNQYGF